MTHWHVCEHQKLCGIVPVTDRGECLAACKLVCDEDVDEEHFQRHLMLLEILVENWTQQHRHAAEDASAQGAAQNAATAARDEAEEWHPKVRRAVQYIRAHAAEPSLTVARVARVVGANSTYLGHIFAEQLGIRMHRYILRQRIELAKRLLATTNWQVKRVAHESGHRNADWFSHVFRAETGFTPLAYRTCARSTRRSTS